MPAGPDEFDGVAQTVLELQHPAKIFLPIQRVRCYAGRPDKLAKKSPKIA
jgi:hypothetical protein